MGSRFILTSIIGTLIAAALALGPVLFPLTGEPRGDLVAALGRFHILVLHFPIALLLMVPVLEILGRFKGFDYLKPAAGVVLTLATLSGATACLLGYLLAAGEGDAGDLLEKHMWGGIITTILMICALILRAAQLQTNLKPLVAAYGGVLLASTVSLTLGSHHGASLVHGEHYLTEKFAAAAQPNITADTPVYAALIQPIFQANCFACHSDVKDKGGLRMDDFARLREGGDGGIAGIEPHDLENSEVYYRITLDPSAKASMPPDGKEPLSAEDIALIAWWIEAGASETATVAELADDEAPAAVKALLQATPRADIPPMDLATFERVAQHVKATYGVDVILNSQDPKDGAYVTTHNATGPITAALFDDLGPLASHITSINLWRCALEPDALRGLSSFKHLNTLHLNETNVDPQELAAASALKLAFLNLQGCDLDDAVIPVLLTFRSLDQLLINDTQISEAGAEALREKLPHCVVLSELKLPELETKKEETNP